MNMIDNAVKSSLTGRIPVIIFVLSILFGLFALKQTPRESRPARRVQSYSFHFFPLTKSLNALDALNVG